MNEYLKIRWIYLVKVSHNSYICVSFCFHIKRYGTFALSYVCIGKHVCAITGKRAKYI